MHSRSKPPNPWNKSQPSKKSKPNIANNNHLPTPSELKFKETQLKLQAAVKKHVEEYESSSDEEELDSTSLIDNVFQNYKFAEKEPEQTSRTHGFIEQALQSGAAACLICISKVKRDDQIWSCKNCYGFFHLMCIQRWSKDTIVQQKQALEDQILVKQSLKISWCCPKCRNEYSQEDIPTKYLCFCKKTENPKHQLYVVPHSCGEICKKDLVPNCGHKCLLLCHPGPCPPCPVIVSVTCYCTKQSPKTQRCSNKEWSCGTRCGKTLECGKHTCPDPCHPGQCKPCSKKSIQKCICKAEQKLRDCATPVWQCERICNKLLDCNNHKCQKVCHSGDCGPCEFTDPRTCPCGKSSYLLPCTEETPSCQDTCDKLLECGLHTCGQRCHKEKCGLCLETVEKLCRCGQHSKEVQCFKDYFCEVKCKRMKDCNRHPCNRKCCNGMCPPCEKPCGRTLKCGNHKCNSVCHRGPCYPCNQTDTVTCRCGATKIVVPCGRKHKTKPPKCNKLCLIPPDCHHDKRQDHKCHFGDCPPCKQICNKSRPHCTHLCPATCHSAIFVKVEGQKASMPWEQTKPQIEKRALPCPECTVPVPVTCLGGHETSNWACYLAKPTSCQRSCGRLLPCSNHKCSLPCHLVENSPDEISAGSNCEECEGSCNKERPEGCQHLCPKPCHPGPCPPCKQMIRIKCHCGLNQPYVRCSDWLILEKREELQSCGNQCPKMYDCGHRCKSNCHSGLCPNPDLCKKKVKITCKCKRIKKEFPCELVRKNQAIVECDETCLKKKEESKKLREVQEEQKRKEEEIRNRKELEKYQKMFEGKKRNKERRIHEEEEEDGFVKKYRFIGLTVLLLAVVIGIYVTCY